MERSLVILGSPKHWSTPPRASISRHPMKFKCMLSLGLAAIACLEWIPAVGAATAAPQTAVSNAATAFDAALERWGPHGAEMAADPAAYERARKKLIALLPLHDGRRRARLDAFDCQHLVNGPASSARQATAALGSEMARRFPDVRADYLVCSTYSLYSDGQRPAYMEPVNELLSMTRNGMLPRHRAAALRMKAFFQRDSGQIAASLATLEELSTLDEHRQSGWTGLLTLVGIADAYIDMGLIDLSEEVIKDVLARAAKSQDGYVLAMAHERMGMVAERRSAWQLALDEYRRAAGIHQRKSHNDSAASVLLRIARIEALEGRVQDARRDRVASELLMGQNAGGRLMKARRLYVDALIALGERRPADALALARRAKDGYLSSADFRSVGEVMDLEVRALRSLQQWREALETRDEQVNLQRRLDVQMRKEQSRFVIGQSERVRHDMDAMRLAQEAAMQRQEVRSMKREAKMRRALTVALVVLLLLLTGGLVFTLKRLKGVRRQVVTDSLTGAASRRSAMARLSRALERQTTSGFPVAVVLIDVDHFKLINDTRGHAVGDEVLRRISRACMQVLRSSDVFGRIGGEEFIVVMTAASKDDPILLAERLRKRVSELELGELSQGLVATISLGVAVAQRGESKEQLLVRADAALYRAKRAGRNQLDVDDLSQPGV